MFWWRLKNWLNTVGLTLGLLLVVLVALAGVVAFVFWIRSVETTGGASQASCVLVIDRTTSSSSDPMIVARYRGLAEKTVRGCADLNASLSIFYFDQGSPKLVLAGEEPEIQPFDLFLPEGTSDVRQEAALEKEIEEALRAVDQVFEFESDQVRASDIATAYHDAAANLRIQAQRDGVTDRFLVILTDGIQLSGDVSVTMITSEDFDPQALVDRVSALDLVPDLQGTQVTFVGIRRGESESGEQVPEWFDTKIKQFWELLTTAGQGSMCGYLVDAVILPVGC